MEAQDNERPHKPKHPQSKIKPRLPLKEIIELALTAGFYAMVPRVLNALKVPIEDETLHAPVGRAEKTRAAAE